MKSRRTSAAVIALAASVMLGAATADAQSPAGGNSVAVLSVEITGDAPPELRPQLQRSLAGGLSAGGAKVVSLDDVSSALAARPELVGCTSTTCLAEIADLVGAERFAKARVDATGSTYLIELELLSPDTEGAVVSRVERECTVCSIMEANDRVSEAARELLRPAEVRSARLRVASDPQGATVAVDGVDVGSTPFEGELAPGEHRITVRKEGFAEAYRTVEVKPLGKTGPVDMEFELTENTALVEEADAPQRPYRVLKWAAGGGAVVALTTGAILLAIDGNQLDCGREEPQTQCPELRETTLGGVASLIAGAALGGASAWMFLSDQRAADTQSETSDASGQNDGPSASIAVTRGGGMATFRVRF